MLNIKFATNKPSLKGRWQTAGLTEGLASQWKALKISQMDLQKNLNDCPCH